MTAGPPGRPDRFDEVARAAARAFRLLPATPYDRPPAGRDSPQQVPRRITTGSETVERDLMKLVLTIVELLRQLMERQALHRVEAGDLTEEQEEDLGATLMALHDRMTDLCDQYGLTMQDLNLDLGPLGPSCRRPTDPGRPAPGRSGGPAGRSRLLEVGRQGQATHDAENSGSASRHRISGGGAEMSMVKESVEVDVPLHTAYNQWTQFEEFPKFMEGVDEVVQLDERRSHWRTSIAGVSREFDTEIVDQLSDERVAWRTTGGDVRQKGVVTFQRLDDSHTRINLAVDFTPEGVAEKAGDALGLVDRRVKGDLLRFKDYIEQRGVEGAAGGAGSGPREQNRRPRLPPGRESAVGGRSGWREKPGNGGFCCG